MTVAFDAVSLSPQDTGNLSWTHTPVGTPRGVIVEVVFHSAVVAQVSGVTYGGVNMAEVAGSPNIHDSGEDGGVHTFFLGASIPTGPQTVLVTVSGAAVKNAVAYTVTAAADTEVVDTDVSINSATAVNPSAVLALGGRTCFASIAFFSGQDATTSITPLSGWTNRQEVDFGLLTAGWYTYDTIGSADVTAGWTQASDQAAAIALAISEVQAGVVGSRRPMMNYGV